MLMDVNQREANDHAPIENCSTDPAGKALEERQVQDGRNWKEAHACSRKRIEKGARALRGRSWTSWIICFNCPRGKVKPNHGTRWGIPARKN